MKTERITKNAILCGICGAPADRIGGPEKVTGRDHTSGWYFQCQKHPGHKADGLCGIFSDSTYPKGKTQ